MEGLPHVAEAMNCSSKNVPKTPTKTGSLLKPPAAGLLLLCLWLRAALDTGPWLHPSDKFNGMSP